MNSSSKNIALGGVLGALAVCLMILGGMIPLSTYVCPLLAMVILSILLVRCGKRIGWSWYGAVAILGLLLSPDKEAAAVFAVLGYYPLIKPFMEKTAVSWLLKALFFNAVIIGLYIVLLYIMGMEQLVSEFSEMGLMGMAITLLLGNVCFFLLDRLLTVLPARIGKRKKGNSR